MADGDPEDDLNLDPPEDETPENEEQDEQADSEQEDEPGEGEVDAQPGDEPSDQPEQRPASRGERRFQTLSRELQEQRTRNEELNRRLDQVLLGQPRPQGETPEQRAQRLAVLTPEERITETLREDRERHAYDMHRLQFSIQDGNDRSAFEAKATVDRLYDRWRPKVEAELTALRAKGQNVGREQLMFYLIGQNAVQSRKEAGAKQRQQARGRVERQRTGAPNGRSDTQATRRQQGNSLERRLENVQI